MVLLPHVSEVRTYLLSLQQQICSTLESIDGVKAFESDVWERQEGGGGISAVIKKSRLFEQAGVNFSHVKGASLPPSASAHRPELAGSPWEALGVSLVFHPWNPYIPTVHFNVRYFTTPNTWWFGGGFDLTPYYAFEEDCIHWHQNAYEACAEIGHEHYYRMKKACDEYFFLKHRQEARGIGGLFFDDWNEGGFPASFSWMKRLGSYFLSGYRPILEKRQHHKYSSRERQFQLFRRGRYVEFNLLYDRGTLFGIQSQGRTESILMSLPPQVCWEYGWAPEPHSQEALLTEKFLKPQDWLQRSGD